MFLLAVLHKFAFWNTFLKLRYISYTFLKWLNVRLSDPNERRAEDRAQNPSWPDCTVRIRGKDASTTRMASKISLISTHGRTQDQAISKMGTEGRQVYQEATTVAGQGAPGPPLASGSSDGRWAPTLGWLRSPTQCGGCVGIPRISGRPGCSKM